MGLISLFLIHCVFAGQHLGCCHLHRNSSKAAENISVLMPWGLVLVFLSRKLQVGVAGLMLTSLPNYYKKLHQLARPSAVLTLALLPLPSLTQKTSKATFPFFLSPPNLPVSPFFLCWPILLFECEGQRCVLEDEKGNERLNSGEYSPLWISPPPWHFSAHLLCFVWLPPLLTHSHDLHAPLTPADSSTGRGSDRYRQNEYQQISWMGEI